MQKIFRVHLLSQSQKKKKNTYGFPYGFILAARKKDLHHHLHHHIFSSHVILVMVTVDLENTGCEAGIHPG